MIECVFVEVLLLEEVFGEHEVLRLPREGRNLWRRVSREIVGVCQKQCSPGRTFRWGACAVWMFRGRSLCLCRVPWVLWWWTLCEEEEGSCQTLLTV